MLANPFRDIGLRSHHALLKRPFPGVLKIFFLAIGGIRDGTDSQDDLNQTALLHSAQLHHHTPDLIPRFQNFDKNRAA